MEALRAGKLGKVPVLYHLSMAKAVVLVTKYFSGLDQIQKFRATPFLNYKYQLALLGVRWPGSWPLIH